MSDYVPGPDPDFNNWQTHFLDYLNANMAALGLQHTDLTPLTTAQNDWATAYTAHGAAHAAAQEASQTKKASRETFERVLRAMAQRLQTQPGVSDAHRAGMGVSIRQPGHTSVGGPETRPVATIDTSQRLQHTINFSDETTPSRRAKPEGVMGCEIWVKVGDGVPVDPSELKYLAMDTATPYIATYDGAVGGKLAHYMLRWVSRRGEHGPWSQTVSATIIA